MEKQFVENAAAAGHGTAGHAGRQRPGGPGDGVHHAAAPPGRRADGGHRLRRRPPPHSARRRDRQPGLHAAGHGARPAAAADGPRRHRAAVRRRPARAPRPLGRAGQQGDRPGGRRPGRRGGRAGRRAGDPPPPAAAPAADVPLDRAGGDGPVRRAIRPAGDAGNARSWRSISTAGRPSGSPSGPPAAIAWRSPSAAWPAMPASRRRRASAPSPSPRWPSPSCTARAGTGGSRRTAASAPATWA